MSNLARRSNVLGDIGLSLCSCGHLEADHSSLLIPHKKKVFREYHSGGCVECSCKQFTFDRMISLDEASDMIKDRHHQSSV